MIAGKDKGHVGEVIESIPKKGKVVVQGANYKVGNSGDIAAAAAIRYSERA